MCECINFVWRHLFFVHRAHIYPHTRFSHCHLEYTRTASGPLCIHAQHSLLLTPTSGRARATVLLRFSRLSMHGYVDLLDINAYAWTSSVVSVIIRSNLSIPFSHEFFRYLLILFALAISTYPKASSDCGCWKVMGSFRLPELLCARQANRNCNYSRTLELD